MKRKLLRGLAICMAVFPALFTIRLLYGYSESDGSSTPLLGLLDNNNNFNNNEAASFGETRKNYASSKYDRFVQMQLKGSGGSAPAQVDQKYEKVATLRAESAKFDDDEARLRASIKHHEAMIQFEQAHGLAGRRQLRMSIGVPPEQFDPMLDEVKKIGTTVEIQVDKTDKTNEYKDLGAQRASLEKARTSLISLKGHGGQIDEQINLENKILDIEEQIQKMGVKLGEFDAENEFVTIHFTLQDRPPPARESHISFRHRVVVALHWSVMAYVALVGVTFFAGLTVLIILGILQKLKWLPEVARKLTT
jgi:hypothetical protein